LKYRAYHPLYANTYFWRIYSGQKIDLVEEYASVLHGCEFKWSHVKPVTAPKAWVAAYPESNFTVIHPGNYQEFLSG
jgi:hypothetical protein